jgi:hypothetical protein
VVDEGGFVLKPVQDFFVGFNGLGWVIFIDYNPGTAFLYPLTLEGLHSDFLINVIQELIECYDGIVDSIATAECHVSAGLCRQKSHSKGYILFV